MLFNDGGLTYVGHREDIIRQIIDEYEKEVLIILNGDIKGVVCTKNGFIDIELSVLDNDIKKEIDELTSRIRKKLRNKNVK